MHGNIHTFKFQCTAMETRTCDIVVPPLHKCTIFYFSVEPHSKEIISKSIESNDPWSFSGKSLFDSDTTTLLFDVKPSSLGTIVHGTEGMRYSAKWLRYSNHKYAGF